MFTFCGFVNISRQGVLKSDVLSLLKYCPSNMIQETSEDKVEICVRMHFFPVKFFNFMPI